MNRTLRLVTTALSLCALSLAMAAGEAKAEPADVGSITITSSVEGGGSAVGTGYSLTSSNCLLADSVQKKATSDAEGVAVFAGLPRVQEGRICRYDIEADPREGLEAVGDLEGLRGLTAGESVPLKSTVQLVEVAGVFSNISRNPEPGGNTLQMFCVTGSGTNEIRAGRVPGTASQCPPVGARSGVRLVGADVPMDLSGGSYRVATLTHMNNTIQRGFHNADLSLVVSLRDSATDEVKTVRTTYRLSIDETNDSVLNPATCKYPDVTDENGVNLNGVFSCADRITLTPADSHEISLGNTGIDLNLTFGRLGSDGKCSGTADLAYTAERQNTNFCLLAGVTPVEKIEGTKVAVAYRATTASPVPSATPPATSSVPSTTPPATSPTMVAPTSTQSAHTSTPPSSTSSSGRPRGLPRTGS